MGLRRHDIQEKDIEMTLSIQLGGKLTDGAKFTDYSFRMLPVPYPIMNHAGQALPIFWVVIKDCDSHIHSRVKLIHIV